MKQAVDQLTRDNGKMTINSSELSHHDGNNCQLSTINCQLKKVLLATVKGDVIADEVVCLGISVRNLCAMAHISKTTYYELLKGNTTP